MSDIRYTDEFCIVRENGTNAIVLNELLSGRVETLQQIEKHSDLSTIDVAKLPLLPNASEAVEKNKLYSYESKAVCCIQSHNRTIYAPELTPALFSFFRTNTDDLAWIANEKVSLGWFRTYNNKKYECIQAHMTLESWKPDVTPALWKVVVVVNPEIKPPQWVTGNWATYTLGYRVFDSGKVWEVKGVTHTWIQPSLTGNGAISWKYIKDWV